MNKAEMINEISLKSEMTKKDSETALNAIIDVIKDALADGEKIQLAGFGTFEIRERKERTGVNPKNPQEKIKIAACKAPVWKASKVFKDALNQ